MDIMNIQALIAQGFITDVASIDPNKAYIAVGVYQPGNRPAGSSNANTYPSYAIPVSEFLSGAGLLTGVQNGLSLVGTVAELGGSLIHTTDININGQSLLFKNGVYPILFLDPGKQQVAIGGNNPTGMLDITAAGSGTVGLQLNTSSTQDAKLHFRTNNAATARSQVYVEDASQTLNIYTVNSDTIFWNGNGLAQVKTLTLLTNTDAWFNGSVGIGTNNPLSLLYVNASVQNEQITLNNDDITGSSYFALSQSGGTKAGMILLNSNHPFIPKTLIIRNLWDAGSLRINGGSADTNMMFFDTTTFHVGINTQAPGARLDVQGDATNPLFKLNNSNFLFADKLRVNNNGDFYSGSINAFGDFGQADFTTDHLNYKFNTSYQTYLAFTNAGGSGNKGGYGIIGSTIASADSDYRLVVLNNDAGTLGSVLKVVSTAINNANDGFDYTNYGVNVLSNGIFTNTGAGTFYKVGINLDITNGDVNRAINVENGVIRVVKANQPLYATLTAGDFYYDTAANILGNGDFVVGMKA